MRRCLSITAPFLAWLALCTQAQANTSSAAELEQLRHYIQQHPQDLDAYFAYAQAAAVLGMVEEAKQAYLHMLAVDPLLHRVKLDLGMLYLRNGQYGEAKALFQQVLDTHPPKEVAANVERVLKQAETSRHEGKFGASVSLGYNYDSNANSAAGSGHITFNDISIPLDPTFQAKKDSQVFAAASLQHQYPIVKSIDKNSYTTYWNTEIIAYRADQANLDEQNLQAWMFEAGPSWDITPLRTRLSMNGGYQHIDLDGRSYLQSKTAELSAVFAYSGVLSFFSSIQFEDRHFINAPRASTYSDRSGEAYQARIGLNYRIGKKGSAGAAITYRREETRKEYYDDNQWNIEVHYTHIFVHNIFATVALNYRLSAYDGPDPLISPTQTREEYEKTIGVTLGKTFKHNITYLLGYQYRRIDADIQNYEYANHRVSVGVGWNY